MDGQHVNSWIGFSAVFCLGKPCNKKNGKKRWQCHPRGEGGHPQYLFLAQIYQGLKSLVNGLCTLTNWPQNVICVHTCMHCGLMCGIWDWQSTIVEDLNDSQDPKHTLFCRENAFVAIYALFSDNKCPLFTRLGGGFAERGQCHLFLPFFLYQGFPNNWHLKSPKCVDFNLISKSAKRLRNS